MLLSPLRGGRDLNFIDSLAQVKIFQRQGHPSDPARGLDLYTVDETALGKLHVVVVDEGIRKSNLLKKSDPGKKHGL